MSITKDNNFDKCSVVLLDVAGTTTSTTFIKNSLLEYALKNVDEFLKEKWEVEEIKSCIKELKDETELNLEEAIKLFKSLTKENSNNKGVKSLQGLIYKKGYEDESLKAHVYSDVPKALENWSKEHKIAIYSTGSVSAQKLLFTHSDEGNLASYISNYFDQAVGEKTEEKSYAAIAKELNVKPEEILFINDNIDELEAAKKAGLLTTLIKREKNSLDSNDNPKSYNIISTFLDISFSEPTKRKKEDEPAEDSEAPPTKVQKLDEEPVKEAPAEKKEEPKAESMEVDVTSSETAAVAKETEESMETEKEEVKETAASEAVAKCDDDKPEPKPEEPKAEEPEIEKTETKEKQDSNTQETDTKTDKNDTKVEEKIVESTEKVKEAVSSTVESTEKPTEEVEAKPEITNGEAEAKETETKATEVKENPAPVEKEAKEPEQSVSDNKEPAEASKEVAEVKQVQENGKSEKQNGNTSTEEVANDKGTESPESNVNDEPDIKIKKLETNEGSPAVSVEV